MMATSNIDVPLINGKKIEVIPVVDFVNDIINVLG
jgi:hypothetical protein